MKKDRREQQDTSKGLSLFRVLRGRVEHDPEMMDFGLLSVYWASQRPVHCRASGFSRLHFAYRESLFVSFLSLCFVTPVAGAPQVWALRKVRSSTVYHTLLKGFRLNYVTIALAGICSE